MTEPVEVRDSAQSKPVHPTPDNTTISPTSGPARKYLTLGPLKKLDLPHHPSYDNVSSDHHVTLAQFLDDILNEVQGINFDEGFEKRGTWSPDNGHVMMPPLNATGNSDMVTVPVSVEKRIKDLNQASWMARTSTHSNAHVRFSELGDLLAKDHSRNEAAYTPSVFDAVELLRWDPEEALRALPIDYASFGDVKIMQERSRMETKGSSQLYRFPSDTGSGATPDANQKQRQGKKLTEGTYVSLERLIGASKTRVDGDAAQQAESPDNDHHRWDMMTLSTAGGMTKKAPKGIQQKETLEAIAMDVEYVLSYIADQRRKSRT
ncbi:hypothetical protein J4E85_005483 [Alternaria conjuncta]|uniref:uncharacterized protein n=1 Tax=Alternaria conjuncta TaxID=181017 RepID=UPI00221E5C3E|nr:uncharacterized protein J4E85_005483 [Alternaria conjuncta]KAI4928861.1 hypothetical protein J4E85_005483 [Alternaria conjuncta]